MNAEAERLGAHDTVARNTSGLDHDEQLSSAYDLALIARAGLQIPAFREYSSMISTKFPGGKAKRGKKRETFMVYNHNPLLTGGYKGAIGVKNGYTVAAGRTFVGAARQGKRTLIVALMNYSGQTYASSAALLDWGFANAKKVEPVGVLVDPLPDPAEEPDQDTVKADDQAGGEASGATDSSGSSLWPFVLIGVPLLLIVGAAATGRFRRPRPAGATAAAPSSSPTPQPSFRQADPGSTGVTPIPATSTPVRGSSTPAPSPVEDTLFDQTADEPDTTAQAAPTADDLADTGPIPLVPPQPQPPTTGSNVRMIDPREDRPRP
jgi:D-alanyl-D-alanine carboxypeptidase